MGIGENIKGSVKEQLGKFTEDDELKAEGRAQQSKGEHQTEETKNRAKAKAHEEKADALQRRQEALEDD
jgi:uncharacterized protein YjbJ (UPF0337 family)